MPREFFSSGTPQQLAAASGQIFEARQQARDKVTDQFDTVDDPGEVGIARREQGFGPRQSFLDRALPREAAADLDPQFPGQDLGPGDVRETSQGRFEPTEPVRRRGAARELEQETPLGTLDPFADLVAREGGGFGLDQQAQRRAAAADLDPQFPDVSLGADDVTRTEGGFGLDPQAERRVAAERFEDQLGREVLPGELQRDGDQFLLPR